MLHPYFSDGGAYSANYADHRQTPAYLLELHALKPFGQRVLGSYALYLGVLEIVGDNTAGLRAAIETDQAARIDPVPIAWDYGDPAPRVEFPSFEYEIVTHPETGVDQIVWSDVPVTLTVEESVRSTTVDPPARPMAYYIPASWSEVIERIEANGIDFEVLDAPAK